MSETTRPLIEYEVTWIFDGNLHTEIIEAQWINNNDGLVQFMREEYPSVHQVLVLNSRVVISIRNTKYTESPVHE